jgi:hypothetical protein
VRGGGTLIVRAARRDYEKNPGGDKITIGTGDRRHEKHVRRSLGDYFQTQFIS